MPEEAQKDKQRNQRARVIIAFFGLNERDELLWGRAEKLRELEKSLAQINSKSKSMPSRRKTTSSD